MKFVIIEDRTDIESLDAKCVELLKEHNAIKKDGVNQVYFCGLLVSEGLCIVSLPRASLHGRNVYNYSDIKLASLMIKTLTRYFDSEKRKSISESLDEDSKNNLTQLQLILSLLYDYINYGLYRKQKKTKRKNTGKINWSRTIKSEVPIINASESAVYLNLHSDLVKKSSDSIISRIHAEVIRRVDKLFGWFISMDDKRIAQDLDSIPAVNIPKEHMIRLLSSELRETYYDRDVKLINNMISFISNDFYYGGEEDTILVGIYKFDYAWEELLRITLPDTIKVNDILPKPVITYTNGSKSNYLRGMITDIICKKDDVIATIDAKYYKASEPKNSPGWPDVTKQLFYVNAMRYLFPHCSQKSWFIFPGQFELKISGPLTKVSIEDPRIKKSVNDTFIATNFAYFCPLEVMSHYCNNREYDFEEVNFLFL